MSLGQEIAPFLPFLRRHARAMLGGQDRGDASVRATLEAILAEPDSFPRDVEARLGLYRIFYDSSKAVAAESRARDVSASEEGIAHRRLGALTARARAALLLTALDGFLPSDVGYILSISSDEVEGLVAEGLDEIGLHTKTEVLIIEDEPIISMDLQTIVRDMGHDVTAIAVTRDEAVRAARERPPGLILADIQLADDNSGIDAVRDIKQMYSIPVIFITAFPERLLTGERPEPTFLITKPFHRSTVKAAISQALFFHDAVPEEGDEENPELLMPLASHEAKPRPSPVDAKVIGGQLRLSDDSTATGLTDLAGVEAVRRLHYDTSRRLCESLAGSNVGPGFNARLLAVRRVLSRKLTRERSLQLAVQARGLEGMMPAISERLDDVTAADIGVFVNDLMESVRQFPSFREFVSEASNFVEVTDHGRQIALDLAAAIEAQAPRTVDPALKQAITEIRQVSEYQKDRVSDLALLRTVGNAFRAIARAVNRSLISLVETTKRRTSGVRKRAGEVFDEKLGSAIGTGLVRFVTGTATVVLLTALGRLFPTEFGFVNWLIRSVEIALKGLF